MMAFSQDSVKFSRTTQGMFGQLPIMSAVVLSARSTPKKRRFVTAITLKNGSL
jgi:hypothetical protein